MTDKTIETNVLGWSFAGWRRFAMSAKEDGRAFPATILCFGAKAAELHHALDAIAKEHLIRRPFSMSEETAADPGISDIAAAGARATLTGFWRKRREDDPVPPGGHAGEWVFVAKEFSLASEEPLHLKMARQREADEAARKARKTEEGDAFQKRWNTAFGDLFEEAMAGFGRMGGSDASGSKTPGSFVSAADKEHLAALGLSAMPGSKDELHQAYKSAMKRWHPDAGEEPDGGKAALANAARDALSPRFA